MPQLTSEAGVASFVRGYLGHRFASTKQVAQMTNAFVESIMQFALDHKIDLVRFKKGQRKDHVMQARLRAFKKKHQQGVVFIGVAQEKARVPEIFVVETEPMPLQNARYPSVQHRDTALWC